MLMLLNFFLNSLIRNDAEHNSEVKDCHESKVPYKCYFRSGLWITIRVLEMRKRSNDTFFIL